MKKFLLISGIVLLVVGVLALAVGLFFGFASKNVLDGPIELYAKQRMRMLYFMGGGIIGIIGGIISLVCRNCCK